MALISLFNIYYGQTFPQNITPVRGTLWYDTSANTLKVYNGNQWISVVSANNGESGGNNGNTNTYAGYFISTDNIKMVTQNYSVNLSSDFVLFVNASNGNINIILPNGTDGRMLYIKRIDSSQNVVTLSGHIDNATSITFDPQEYKFLIFYSGSWRVFGS